MLHRRIITPPDRTATVLQELAKDPSVTHITARPVSRSASLGNDMEDRPMEVLVMGSAQSPHPPVVRLSDRAQAELNRPGFSGGWVLWLRLGSVAARQG